MGVSVPTTLAAHRPGTTRVTGLAKEMAAVTDIDRLPETEAKLHDALANYMQTWSGDAGSPACAACTVDGIMNIIRNHLRPVLERAQRTKAFLAMMHADAHGLDGQYCPDRCPVRAALEGDQP